ncbi:MAG TPA: hypothetical protein VK699_20820 [Terriglobales bacterium]|jgi:hypothetical protein|nr:hypothetical protein [Terriglobales bacterium]
MLADQLTGSWGPSNEAERVAVREQLEKLLLDSHFSSSKRYPSFLRFVLEHTLAGESELLKERTLGIEIFGRPPDYDTAADPIVRVTAAEIRKRIEQYYQNPATKDEIRLFLPSGSYALQFCAPHPVAAPAIVENPADPKELPALAAEPQSHETPPSRSKAIVASAVLVILLSTVSFALWRLFQVSPAEQFWAPFVKSKEPVLFCIADQNQYSVITLLDAADPQRKTTLKDNLVTVVIDDVNPLIGIAGVLQNSQRSYRVQGQFNTTLTDLRSGPSVLIGAYDNGWTLRLTGPLRFHFANDPEMTRFWIEDRTKPGNREWLIDRSQQLQTATYKDYAIVARFVDPNTDQFTLVAAGIARGGTVAAGEFLVDAKYINELTRQLPANWSHKNIEIVLETQVIDSHSGPPHIAAVHVW